MRHARKDLCGLLVLALLAAAALSGCGGSERSPTPVAAASGLVGGIVSGLKREDDETELKEIREAAPQSKEEREEARQQAAEAGGESSDGEEGPQASQGEEEPEGS
jgi:hypothetical protein